MHGFLEAHIAGNPKALGMIRAHMNIFNNHSLLPTFLPPDGGNWPWQVPAGPWPPGINNKTSYTGSTLTGHTIYLIVQGLIHSTRMALSEAGTQADVDLLESIYIEPWWLQALAARDVTVISHKMVRAAAYPKLSFLAPFFSHSSPRTTHHAVPSFSHAVRCPQLPNDRR